MPITDRDDYFFVSWKRENEFVRKCRLPTLQKGQTIRPIANEGDVTFCDMVSAHVVDSVVTMTCPFFHVYIAYNRKTFVTYNGRIKLDHLPEDDDDRYELFCYGDYQFVRNIAGVDQRLIYDFWTLTIGSLEFDFFVDANGNVEAQSDIEEIHFLWDRYEIAENAEAEIAAEKQSDTARFGENEIEDVSLPMGFMVPRILADVPLDQQPIVGLRKKAWAYTVERRNAERDNGANHDKRHF